MNRILTELRCLLILAWPVVLGQLGTTLMGVEDLIMIGPLGENAVAAVGAGNLWSFGVLVLAMGTLRGLDPVYSQAHGAGDATAGAAALARGIVLALLLSVPVMALHLLGGPMLALLGQPAEVISDAGTYTSILAIGVPFLLVYVVIAQFLQGMGRMVLPMVVVIVGNLLNILLNWVFIRGGLFGIELGVVGCAMSTAIGRSITPILLLALSWSILKGYRPPPLSVVLQRAKLMRLVRLGVPVGMQYGLEVWAFNAAGLMMGWLGTTALAAHMVALNVTSLTFMIPFGLGIAASTRVGNLLGAGKDWVMSGWIAVGLGASWMAMSGVVLWTFAEPLVRIYISDPPVVALAASLLPLAAMFQLCDGVQAVSAGVLRGAGDTTTPAFVSLIGFWGLGIPAGWWLGIRGDAGPQGVWVALVVGLCSVAVLLVVRLWWLGRRGGIRV
ncbi:MAG: MATE family multidrug resistance protein [Myxococcota bacterium]